jgi:hypothetical protein
VSPLHHTTTTTPVFPPPSAPTYTGLQAVPGAVVQWPLLCNPQSLTPYL